jgi:hypothetical protein
VKENLRVKDVICKAQSFAEDQARQVRQEHSQEIRAIGAKQFWDDLHAAT